jgi:hypothetical protein
MTALLDEQNSSILVIIKFIIAAKGDRFYRSCAGEDVPVTLLRTTISSK